MDPYAYVGDNPETRNDPSGHCWPLCTMILGAVLGAAISVATTVVSNAVQGKPTTLGEVAQSAVVGAVSGAVSGLVGPEAGPVAKMAVGALASGAWQMAGNAMSGKPLMDGVAQAAVVGGITGGAMEGAGALLKGASSEAGEAAESAMSDAEEGVASDAEDATADVEGGCSFTSQTHVDTAQGQTPIGQMKIGQKVWAWNQTTHKIELEPVEQVWVNKDSDLVDLTIAPAQQQNGQTVIHKQEVIHTNQKHPFLTKEKGFLPVGQIKPGMHLIEANGQLGTVIGWKSVSGTMTMYNLEVAQDHTFMVGDGHWVVHNSCNPDDIRDPRARQLGQRLRNSFNDHLTSKDLEGAWRDMHGNPVPRPGGGFWNHIGEVTDAMQSARNTINTFKGILSNSALSEEDQCIVQCLLGRSSRALDYIDKVLNRDEWYSGTHISIF